MLRFDSEAGVLTRQAERPPISTKQPPRNDASGADSALIRWISVAVPLSAVLTLGVAFTIWWTVL